MVYLMTKSEVNARIPSIVLIEPSVQVNAVNKGDMGSVGDLADPFMRILNRDLRRCRAENDLAKVR